MAKQSSIFAGISQTELVSGEYRFKSPFFIEKAQVMGAFFLCDLKAAQKMLPEGIAPFPMPMKKTLMAISCIEYKTTDIGPYNEVACSLIVMPKGGKISRAFSLGESLLKAHFHTFVFQLPVTTEMSVVGGRDVLSYPKYLADISFRDTGAHRICTLRDKESLEVILELECPKIKTYQGIFNLMRRYMQISTYVADDFKSNALFKIHAPSAGQAFMWPRVGLRLGKHTSAQVLHDLNIGQQIYQFSIPDCEGILIQNQK